MQGVHHHVQEEEQGAVEKGAMGSPGSLPPLPSSPSTSGGSSPSTPRAKKTPGSRPPRGVATPLWKRKSLSRMLSSARSQRAPIIRRLSQSQTKSQEEKLSQSQISSSSSPRPPPCMQVQSHIPVEDDPGSSKEPPIVYNIFNPYNHKQSADTPTRPGEEKWRENRQYIEKESRLENLQAK